MHTVLLFGCDGCGKTTHTYLLIQYLQRQGKVPVRFWVRLHHMHAYVLAQVIRLFLGLSHDVVFFSRLPRPYLEKLRHLILFFEATGVLIRQMLNNLKLRLKRVVIGEKVVAVYERSVIDSLVSLAYYVDDPALLNSFWGRLLRRTIPKGVYIYIKCRPATAVARRLGKEYVDFRYYVTQYLLFNRIAESLNACVINTDEGTVAENFAKVLKCVFGVPRRL